MSKWSKPSRVRLPFSVALEAQNLRHFFIRDRNFWLALGHEVVFGECDFTLRSKCDEGKSWLHRAVISNFLLYYQRPYWGRQVAAGACGFGAATITTRSDHTDGFYEMHVRSPVPDYHSQLAADTEGSGSEQRLLALASEYHLHRPCNIL